MKKIFLGAAVAGIVALVYGYRLGHPPQLYYDEIYHVPGAREILNHRSYPVTSHPPLGQLLIASSIRLFGDHPWAWRFFSLVCGVANIFLIYFLTKELTQDSLAAGFALFLSFADGISLTQARIAMLNAPMLCWALLSLWCLARGSLFVSGVFLGLALATRWVAVGIAGPLAVLFYKLWKQETDSQKKFLIRAALSYLLVPLGVYFLAHSIFFFLPGKEVADIFSLQKHMWDYHAHLQQTHAYGSSWWGWPFLVRPIWYFFERQGDIVSGIVCLGNPAIFWFIPAAIIYALVTCYYQKSRWSMVVLAGLATQWVSWSLMQRVKFFHYFYESMPYVIMAESVLLAGLWRAAGRRGQGLCLLYGAAVAVLFIFWYPLLTGEPVSEWYYRIHLWFKSWI